jgi:FkbM family methyltransferase
MSVSGLVVLVDSPLASETLIEKRKMEYESALLANAASPHIERIVLLNETPVPEATLQKMGTNASKVTTSFRGLRLTYREAMLHAEKHFKDRIVVLANADIDLSDASCAILASLRLEKGVACIARHDLHTTHGDVRVVRRNPMFHMGHDAWVFRATEGCHEALYDPITMGAWFCDAVFAGMMIKAGYSLFNPIDNVLLKHHHESMYHSSTFYSMTGFPLSPTPVRAIGLADIQCSVHVQQAPWGTYCAVQPAAGTLFRVPPVDYKHDGLVVTEWTARTQELNAASRTSLDAPWTSLAQCEGATCIVVQSILSDEAIQNGADELKRCVETALAGAPSDVILVLPDLLDIRLVAATCAKRLDVRGTPVRFVIGFPSNTLIDVSTVAPLAPPPGSAPVPAAASASASASASAAAAPVAASSVGADCAISTQYLRSASECRSETEAALARCAPKIPAGVVWKGQFGQDKFVACVVFQGARDLYFVDVGASDGVEFSNTFALEKSFGWRGICVEAHEGQVADLRRNRPGSTCVHACVGAAGQKVVFQYRSFKAVSGVQNFSTNMTKVVRETEVCCASLSSILQDSSAPPTIDYLSIDVEGYESQVIDSMDFTRWNVRCVTVSHNEKRFKDGAIRRRYISSRLSSNGFHLMGTDDTDDYWVKEELRAAMVLHRAGA